MGRRPKKKLSEEHLLRLKEGYKAYCDDRSHDVPSVSNEPDLPRASHRCKIESYSNDDKPKKIKIGVAPIAKKAKKVKERKAQFVQTMKWRKRRLAIMREQDAMIKEKERIEAEVNAANAELLNLQTTLASTNTESPEPMPLSPPPPVTTDWYKPARFPRFTREPPTPKIKEDSLHCLKASTIRKRVYRVKQRLQKHEREVLLVRNRQNKLNKHARVGVRKSMKLMVLANVSYRGYRILAKDTNLAPARQVEEKRARVLEEAGYEPTKAIEETETEVPVGFQRPLKSALSALISRLKVENFQRPLRVTISGDSGGKTKTTKITTFLSDSETPCSPFQTELLACIAGGDGYENIETAIKKLDKEILELQNEGLRVKDQQHSFEFFVTGDVKFMADLLGLSNQAALYPCIYCLIHKDELDLFDPQNPESLRTLEGLLKNSDSFEHDVDNLKRKSNSAITELRHKYHSIKTKPLLTSIPLSHYAVPPLHILQGCVNFVFKELQLKDKKRAAKLLEDSKTATQKGRRSDLSGKAGSQLIGHVEKETVVFDKYDEAFKAIVPVMELATIGADLTDASTIIKTAISKLRAVRGLTPKLHMLEVHLIPFLERHGSWSRFSEQGTECMHKHGNMAFSKMPSGTVEEKIAFFLKNQLIRNWDDDEDD